MRFVLALLLLLLALAIAESAAANTTGIPCEYFSCWTEGTSRMQVPRLGRGFIVTLWVNTLTFHSR